MDPSVRPRGIRQAAQAFESLLVAQMLKMAHSDDEGWLGSGGDSASAPAMGIAEESLASSICANGGLGLADVIVRSLPES